MLRDLSCYTLLMADSNFFGSPIPTIRVILAVIMLLSAITVAVLVLFQTSNSDGTSAFTGGSASKDNETFYGRNKGRRVESKLKMWTFITAGVLAVCSIVFYVLR
ncbi:MAG: preprotein translocase subunit SecG [Clostridia bacterium]|nr:preprotein translocase subunit SecG [Clostridia bacterium]